MTLGQVIIVIGQLTLDIRGSRSNTRQGPSPFVLFILDDLSELVLGHLRHVDVAMLVLNSPQDLGRFV